MNERADRGQAVVPARAGLCAACRHARVVASDRGGRFVLCQRAAEDPRFARYPPLPVIACAGHEAVGTD